jgi:hypothetical protein
VEGAGGAPLETLLERRIFAPLGMATTRHTPSTAEDVAGLAVGYLPLPSGGWRRAKHRFALGGEGGRISSVPDLAQWHRWLCSPAGETVARGLSAVLPFAGGAVGAMGEAWDWANTEASRFVELWRALARLPGGLYPCARPPPRIILIPGLALIAIQQLRKLRLRGHVGLRVAQSQGIDPAPLASGKLSALLGAWNKACLNSSPPIPDKPIRFCPGSFSR